MDWIDCKDRMLPVIRKYRITLLFLLVGLFLLVSSAPEATEQASDEVSVPSVSVPGLQESLEEILSHVSGAGKVKVLLTQAKGEQLVYQTDEDISSEDIRRETVLTTNSGRDETGLIRQIYSPVYQGAVVLCQGADSASVRLSLVEAVMSVTGLTSDHITVLKMK